MDDPDDAEPISDNSYCWCAHDSGQEVAGQLCCAFLLSVFVVIGVIASPLQGPAKAATCVVVVAATCVVVSWGCHGCPYGSGRRCLELEELPPAPVDAAVAPPPPPPPPSGNRIDYGWRNGAPEFLPPPSPRPVSGVDAARDGLPRARRSSRFIGYSLVRGAGSGRLRIAFAPQTVGRAPPLPPSLPPVPRESSVVSVALNPGLQLRNNVITARDASAPPPPAAAAAAAAAEAAAASSAAAAPPAAPPLAAAAPAPVSAASMADAALQWTSSAASAIAAAAHDAQAAAARALPWLIAPPPERPPRAGSVMAAVVVEQQQTLAIALEMTRRRARELQAQSLEAQRLPQTQQSRRQVQALLIELAHARERERELEERERGRERRERELEGRIESTESRLESAESRLESSAAQARAQLLSLERARARESALGAQVEDLRAARACVVCLDADKDTVLRPCRHECVCAQCATSLTRCPVCRATILAREKVFV